MKRTKVSGLHQISSSGQMWALADQIGRQVRGGDVLLLTGELGTGKTTFVQGLARSLGVAGHITSPSFTIVGEYQVANHQSISNLIHVDLYRLRDEQAAIEPAIREVLLHAPQENRLTVIEWANRLGELAPRGSWRLQFSFDRQTNERRLAVRPPHEHNS
jgi:tRNA threonylcarbamoyladenosine biosynthesis protein TsaE